MNVVLVACCPRGEADAACAAAVLRTALEAQPPFLDLAELRTWASPSGRVAAAWCAHRPDRVGGARYADVERDRLVLWTGRPILWRGRDAEGHPDALLRAFCDEPLEALAARIDGRACVMALDDDGAAVLTDPLGAYPVFRASDGHGTTWCSTHAVAAALAAGPVEPAVEGLAGLVGCGQPLGGHPPLRGVRRLEPGFSHLPSGAEGEGSLLAPPRVAALPGAGWDVAGAGEALVTALRALADWPGRPNVLPITAGRDSRVVLAAAVAAGLEMPTVTGGAPGEPDVEAGRALAELAGFEHALLPADPHGDRLSDPAGAARVLRSTTGATATLADAAGFPLGPWDPAGPLALWHTGQGGEIGRGAWWRAGTRRPSRAKARMLARLLGRRPGRRELLTPAGVAAVRGGLDAVADPLLDAGLSPRELGEALYLCERMRGWAAGSHGAVEPIRDSTSPLWSARVVPHLLGPSRAARIAEHPPRDLVAHLAPQLLAVPYGGGPIGPARGALARRAALGAELTGKAAARVRTRTARRRSAGSPATGSAEPSGPPPDHHAELLAAVRDAALVADGDALWQVVDRDRALALLQSDWGALDEQRRQWVWRLATVLL